MSDSATQAPAPAAAPQTMSTAEAAQKLAERRQAAAAPAQPNASDAARILGQRAAAARQERLAEATRQAQGSAPAEGSNVEDDQTPLGEARDETANDGSPTGTEAQAEDEPGEAQTIDLGEGLTVTLDEIRDGFMMKADHTRKTQSLAEERKAFEADRAQRLSVTDTLIEALRQRIGQPKTLRQYVSEMGSDEGLLKFSEQQEQLDAINAAMNVRHQENTHHINLAKTATINALAETHGDKAATIFSDAVQYAKAQTGLDESYLTGALAHPAAIAMVNDAKAYRELQKNKGQVQRFVADKPKVIKPGAKVSAQGAQHNVIQNAQAKLKSSGQLADAVALLRARRGTRG